MSIEKYLQSFKPSDRLTLVGPFTFCNETFQDPVIFVDGGSQCRTGIEGLCVGDGDSYNGKLDIKLNPQKDFSDLAYVLQHIPASFMEIDLHGFLGGRSDHEMFNFGEIHRFLQCRDNPSKVHFVQHGEDAVMAFSAGNWQFEFQGIFSLLAVEKTLFTLHGDCQYQCQNKTEVQPLSSLGLSNVANGTIYLQCDGPLFVFLQNQNV